MSAYASPDVESNVVGKESGSGSSGKKKLLPVALAVVVGTATCCYRWSQPGADPVEVSAHQGQATTLPDPQTAQREGFPSTVTNNPSKLASTAQGVAMNEAGNLKDEGEVEKVKNKLKERANNAKNTDKLKNRGENSRNEAKKNQALKTKNSTEQEVIAATTLGSTDSEPTNEEKNTGAPAGGKKAKKNEADKKADKNKFVKDDRKPATEAQTTGSESTEAPTTDPKSTVSKNLAAKNVKGEVENKVQNDEAQTDKDEDKKGPEKGASKKASVVVQENPKKLSAVENVNQALRGPGMKSALKAVGAVGVAATVGTAGVYLSPSAGASLVSQVSNLGSKVQDWGRGHTTQDVNSAPTWADESWQHVVSGIDKLRARYGNDNQPEVMVDDSQKLWLYGNAKLSADNSRKLWQRVVTAIFGSDSQPEADNHLEGFFSRTFDWGRRGINRVAEAVTSLGSP